MSYMSTILMCGIPLDIYFLKIDTKDWPFYPKGCNICVHWRPFWKTQYFVFTLLTTLCKYWCRTSKSESVSLFHLPCQIHVQHLILQHNWLSYIWFYNMFDCPIYDFITYLTVLYLILQYVWLPWAWFCSVLTVLYVILQHIWLSYIWFDTIFDSPIFDFTAYLTVLYLIIQQVLPPKGWFYSVFDCLYLILQCNWLSYIWFDCPISDLQHIWLSYIWIPLYLIYIFFTHLAHPLTIYLLRLNWVCSLY